MNYNYTQNIKSLLEISWNEFQMEPGYLKKEKLVEITKEEIIFKPKCCLIQLKILT